MQLELDDCIALRDVHIYTVALETLEVGLRIEASGLTIWGHGRTAINGAEENPNEPQAPPRWTSNESGQASCRRWSRNPYTYDIAQIILTYEL
jgi:hypothetical protein